MYPKAIEAYRQAIRIEPDFAKAHVDLHRLYSIMKDRGSALEEYKILNFLDPEMANKLFNRIYK